VELLMRRTHAARMHAACAVVADARDIMEGDMGICALEEQLALGPQLLAGSPELAFVRARASADAIAIACALISIASVAADVATNAAADAADAAADDAAALAAAVQVSANARSEAAMAAADAEVAAATAAAAAAAAQLAELADRRAYDDEWAEVHVPSAVMFMLLLCAYEWKSSTKRIQLNLQPMTPEDGAALAAGGSRLLTRLETIRLYHDTHNWSAFAFVTAPLLALLAASRVSIAARQFYVRFNTPLLAVNWVWLYIVAPIVAHAHAMRYIPPAARFGMLPAAWWGAVLYTYTAVSAMSPMHARPLAVLVQLRGLSFAVLAPLGLISRSAGPITGDTTGAELVLVIVLASVALSRYILANDARNFSAWREARRRRLMKASKTE
jgi:hypothetical protein